MERAAIEVVEVGEERIHFHRHLTATLGRVQVGVSLKYRFQKRFKIISEPPGALSVPCMVLSPTDQPFRSTLVRAPLCP